MVHTTKDLPKREPANNIACSCILLAGHERNEPWADNKRQCCSTEYECVPSVCVSHNLALLTSLISLKTLKQPRHIGFIDCVEHQGQSCSKLHRDHIDTGLGQTKFRVDDEPVYRGEQENAAYM